MDTRVKITEVRSTKSVHFRNGQERGHRIASWVELPVIGAHYYTEVSGRTCPDSQEAAGYAFAEMAAETEAHDRSSADWINGSAYAMLRNAKNQDKAWGEFEDGVQAGIEACWNERVAGGYYDED